MKRRRQTRGRWRRIGGRSVYEDLQGVQHEGAEAHEMHKADKLAKK